ncbi:MAG: dienelactone hydrolase family protein [Novosphingobium sp.]
MPREEIAIPTPDGPCRAFILTPGGEGPWPAVIFFMDGLGIRPPLIEMAERLARGGYLVLLPDLFFRAGSYEPLDAKAVFVSGDIRGAIAHLTGSTSTEQAVADTAAFLAYLDTRGDVKGSKVGTTGYCMGGGISLSVAGTYPDRVAAAASFHGGDLATDAGHSPHLLAPAIKARVYVAGADHDASYPPEMERRLDQALSDAGVRHACEIYEGAYHGWTMTDFPIHNEAAAERHWNALLGLFDEELR